MGLQKVAEYFWNAGFIDVFRVYHFVSESVSTQIFLHVKLKLSDPEELIESLKSYMTKANCISLLGPHL